MKLQEETGPQARTPALPRGQSSQAGPEVGTAVRDHVSEANLRYLQRTAGNAAVSAYLLQRQTAVTTTTPPANAPAATAGAGSQPPTVSSPPVSANGPPVVPLTRKQRLIIEGLLLGSTVTPMAPWAITIESARLTARLLGATVGIGVGGEVGAFMGVLGGVGLYFTPDGDIGGYGSLGGEIGFLDSASATVQFAITRGGLENFAGPWLCFGASGGEVLVGGATVITDIYKGFLGIAGQFGVGVGLPVDIYWTVSNTWATRPIVNAPLPP